MTAVLVWSGAAPSQATGESVQITGVNHWGCQSTDLDIAFHLSGFDGSGHTARILATAGGKTYMDSGFVTAVSSDTSYQIWDDTSYGPVANKGTWPIPQNTPVEIVIDFEKPKGTVVTASKIVLSGCNNGKILFIGAPSQDTDDDYVPATADKCPSLQAFTSDGCPVHDRSLVIRAKRSPNRITGRLYAAGHPELYVRRTVTVWKKRPGPDKKIATRTTNSLGKFRLAVGKGRYYATSADFIVPTSGEAAADTSNVVRIR